MDDIDILHNLFFVLVLDNNPSDLCVVYWGIG